MRYTVKSGNSSWARHAIAALSVWSISNGRRAGRKHQGRAIHRPNWSRFIILAVLSAMVLTTGPIAWAKSNMALFGSLGIRKDSINRFPKWTDMLARYAEEMSVDPTICSKLVIKKCIPVGWLNMVEQLKGYDRSTQMQFVNSFINRGHYAQDSQNWGVSDYWATPRQFLANSGDCEDFAIAKYLTLKRLGMNPSDMRIVVLQDQKRRVNHAVLAVFQENDILILDNLINRPVRASDIHHYKPMFALNEEAWWLYESKPGKGN